jgi:hypothetical protein
MHQKPWLNKIALIGCVVTAAALLAACGGSSQAGTTASSQVSPRCQQQIAGLLAALDTIRGRLVNELEYPEYVREVRRLQTAYARTRLAGLPRDCLRGPAATAERAVNDYVRAANTWTRCVADRGCPPESARPRVEKRWWTAGLLVSSLHRQVPGKTSYVAGLPAPPP